MPSETKSRTDRAMRTRWVGLLMTGALVSLLVACSGDGAAPAETAPAPAAADDHDGDAHDEAEADQEGDAHDEADHKDGAANAYLEVEPKDALFLMLMTNFAYTPRQLDVNVGEVIEIAIQNVTAEPHDFTIERIDAELHVSYLGGTGEHVHTAGHPDADLHFVLSEPGSGVVHIKVLEAGEYVFYCTVPGHRELGMEGILRVN